MNVKVPCVHRDNNSGSLVFFIFLRKKTMPMLYIKKNQGPAKRKKQCPVEHAPPRQIKEKNV